MKAVINTSFDHMTSYRNKDCPGVLHKFVKNVCVCVCVISLFSSFSSFSFRLSHHGNRRHIDFVVKYC